jgi:uncharacterized protein YchJ
MTQRKGRNTTASGGGHGKSTPADEFRSFLAVCGRMIHKHPDPQAFVAWALESSPLLLTSMAAQLTDPVDSSRAFRMLAINVLKQMPVPTNRWQPKPLELPGRNDPCWCGSGDKFRACCESIANRTLPSINMLRYVLDSSSLRQVAELASTGHPSLEAVADTARQWIEEGQSKRAVVLLEPFFVAPQALPVTLSMLFDELMSALQKEKRRERRFYWVDEVLARGDSAFKSAAMQQRAVMHCDEGAFEASWADFAKAQHFNPNDPSLSMLEVTLLMGQNRLQQACERAAWWAKHLTKLREPSYAGLIEHLQSISTGPTQAMMDLAGENSPGLDSLFKLVQTAPAPALMHTLRVHDVMPDPNEAALAPMAQVQANAKLKKLEGQWRQSFAQIKPMLVATQNDAPQVWDNIDEWVGLLQRNPALLNSFDVLDDLVMATDALELSMAGDALLVLLAERAGELLRLLLETQATPVRVPWVIQENRMVLRPIAHLAYVCKATNKWDRFMQLARGLAQTKGNPVNLAPQPKYRQIQTCSV